MRKITLIKLLPDGRDKKRFFHMTEILLGVLWAICITVAITVATGVYIMVSATHVYYMPLLVTTITLVSAFIGGLVSGMLINQYGLCQGALVGTGYALLYALFAIQWGVAEINLSLVTSMVLIILAAALGGITGSNFAMNKKNLGRSRS